MQRAVAYCLKITHAQVTAKCRRTGGGFGGKATRTPWIGCAAAIGAKKRTFKSIKQILHYQLFKIKNSWI